MTTQGNVATETMTRGEAHFDMCGTFLYYPLHTRDEPITQGMAERLYRFALRRLQDAGFNIKSFNVTVSTMDGNLPQSERYFCVEWKSPKGGVIGVQGILTRKGYPFLDHGIYANG